VSPTHQQSLPIIPFRACCAQKDQTHTLKVIGETPMSLTTVRLMIVQGWGEDEVFDNQIAAERPDKPICALAL